ncbi:hypothetical protein RND71_033553 [Anisodus tanguticus]|uniref:Uncharacterized protein n=1 Tax=Anisodus tanguticus TaxID=243964 RepID=A0AAE1V3C1_9SOLA|nr:hypothetical protein RND71_033553 [Anisodus tanguticus]
MDFTLDTDFGKISSFNIDMSDLDISSPCKKDRKSKETSKEESTVSVNKKKGDGFNFSFDFELDNFGFGSSQESKGKAQNNQEKDTFSFGSTQESREEAKNDQEKECSSSKRSGNEGSGSHLNEDIGLLEDGTVQKHTASEAEMTLTIDTHVDIDKSHDTTKHSLPSNHTMSNDETPKLQSASNEVALEKAKCLLQEKISTSTHETVCQVEEGTPLISQSELRDPSSCLQDHVHYVTADVSVLSVGTDANKKVILDSDTNYDKSVLKSSSSEDVATSMKDASERRNFENDKHVLETNKDRTETHSNSMSNATEDNMQDMKVGNEIQSPTSELSASSLSNGIVAENLTAEKRSETGVIRSKFFMPSIKPAAQMQTTTLWTETKVSEFSNKRIGPVPHSRPDELISRVNPPSKNQQIVTSTSRCIAIPRNIAPIPTAKNTPKEGDKTLPIKAARSLLETSSLKISAKLGTNPETPRTVLQKSLKSSKTEDHHGGSKAILQAKDNFTETLKQMPVNLSMKRKVPELHNHYGTSLTFVIALNADKFGFDDPASIKASFAITQWKQVNDHEHSGNGNTKTSEYENCQISLRDLPMSMNIKELGSPSAIEDDDNIKIAQALSKDLDDAESAAFSNPIAKNLFSLHSSSEEALAAQEPRLIVESEPVGHAGLSKIDQLVSIRIAREALEEQFERDRANYSAHDWPQRKKSSLKCLQD